MARPHYYLRSLTKNTPQVLYLGLRHESGTQLVVSTSIKIHPDDWDNQRGKLKNRSFPRVSLNSTLASRMGNSDPVSFINGLLAELKVFVENRADRSVENLKSEIGRFINGRDANEDHIFELTEYLTRSVKEAKANRVLIDKQKLRMLINDFHNAGDNQAGLFEYFESFIKKSQEGLRTNSGKRLATNTIRKYPATLALLKEFQKCYSRELNFHTIDKVFYDAFISWSLKEKSYTPSTMKKHITILKLVMREALEEGIHSNLGFLNKGMNIKSQSPVHVALTESEIQEISAFDFSFNPRLDSVRDYFLIGCFTGLRHSDFTRITLKSLVKTATGFQIELLQTKTKNPVIVPVSDQVLTIFQKYNFELPKPISNQKFNSYLKEAMSNMVSLQATVLIPITRGGLTLEVRRPKYELITSHTARRSFATNAFEKGIPVRSIMAITGHQTERDFFNYVKTDQNKHLEIFRSYGTA